VKPVARRNIEGATGLAAIASPMAAAEAKSGYLSNQR